MIPAHWHRGRCVGGPYNARTMVDTREVVAVAIDLNDILRRPIPGLQRASARYPKVCFGTYSFADGAWTWRESAGETPDSVNK